MIGKTMFIGCKLPHGIILNHPTDEAKTVELQGINKSDVIGATYKTNEVDAEFWEIWSKANKEFKPFKSGAIFVAKTEVDLKAAAKDLKKEKTGFEQLNPESYGVKPVTAD